MRDSPTYVHSQERTTTREECDADATKDAMLATCHAEYLVPAHAQLMQAVFVIRGGSSMDEHVVRQRPPRTTSIELTDYRARHARHVRYISNV